MTIDFPEEASMVSFAVPVYPLIPPATISSKFPPLIVKLAVSTCVYPSLPPPTAYKISPPLMVTLVVVVLFLKLLD